MSSYDTLQIFIQPKRKRKETTRSEDARPAKLTGWKSRRRKCRQKNRWRSLWNLHSLSGHLLSHRHLICASHLPHSHSPLQEWQTCLSHCSVSPLTCIATVFYLVSPLHCCLHDMFSKVQETFFFLLNGKSDYAVSELNKECHL